MIKEYGYAPNERQRTVLNRFARCYPFFIEYVFPNSQQKLNILKKVTDIVCEEAPKISIRTLDGEVINCSLKLFTSCTLSLSQKEFFYTVTVPVRLF
jgi:hypothetical protein